ncbi:3-phenylpropionate/trans-cinnamate dioxygenase ferredoxin reductase subunit [Kitasatospora sp. MAA4]|uniref:NAD(P)/FAD-dependent oxidoreductase n=1 Tax=Kitasatospora sp. MAA4 TaxID=3035093 RepID=UPI00247344AB|nr:FAD-dependent oxidoreductase [Kitasatospora sp. MAA4]MDH6132031.1 3-phenylpropionate/trans-cinnamate dioxygenase ferredoxin reductase subunit [Kitasatospora sp. MAA4]
MDANTPHVIVGASLAGASAARTLREEGWQGPLVLIGEESELPYERPPLSKGYLMGAEPREKVFVHPQEWYREQRIDLRLGTRVTAVDPAAHRITLQDGATLDYAKLLLTTGSSPRPLPVPGAELDGVHYLRTLGDSDRLRAAFRSADRIAVIGAGWIGLEAAAAARGAGVQVAVLESAGLPLLRVLGPEVAEVFAALHRDHDVQLHFGVQVQSLTGGPDGVTGVRLADGTVVEADAVLIGIGITPNTALAQAAGITVENGVKTDQSLRTSDPDVFAAGDVANAYHPLLGRHLRVEHWANAVHQPRTAARAMLGQDVAFDRTPYFFTDQYDLGMEYTGYVEPGGYDRVVFRGDVAAREFIAFWLSGGRVLAGMNVNVWDVTDPIRELVRSGRVVDLAKLADPAVPLTELPDAG